MKIFVVQRRGSFWRVQFASVRPHETVKLLDGRFELQLQLVVAFANRHALNVASRDEHFRAILRKSIVLNDGIGMDHRKSHSLRVSHSRKTSTEQISCRIIFETRGTAIASSCSAAVPGCHRTRKANISPAVILSIRFVGYHHGYLQGGYQKSIK